MAEGPGWEIRTGDFREERIKAGLARRKTQGLPVGGSVSRRGPDRKPRRTDGYKDAWQRRRGRQTGPPLKKREDLRTR